MLRLVAAIRVPWRKRLAAARDGGVTSIEYVLIATLIAVVIVGVVALIGGEVNGFFSQAAAHHL
jgi:Flp pilus assembly pilin Flp